MSRAPKDRMKALIRQFSTPSRKSCTSNKMTIPQTFDRNHIRRVRRRAAARLQDHDFLLTWTRQALEDRLKDVKRRLPLALQIGARGGAAQSSAIDRLVVMDTMNADIIAAEEQLPFAANTF